MSSLRIAVKPVTAILSMGCVIYVIFYQETFQSMSFSSAMDMNVLVSTNQTIFNTSIESSKLDDSAHSNSSGGIGNITAGSSTDDGRGAVKISSVQRNTTLYQADNTSIEPIICSDYKGGGRVGNQMFRLAAGLGIATKLNMTLVVPKPVIERLEAVFDRIPRDHFRIGQCPAYVNITNTKLKGAKAVQPDFFHLPREPFKLEGFFHNPTYFAHLRGYLKRQIFTFPAAVTEKTQTFLNGLRWTKGNQTVIVGIHVRRGDYASERFWNVQPPNITYFQKAMDYFREKYTKVQFIVCSDGIDWCAEQFAPYPNVTLHHGSVQEDLAILVACDHMIMSFGTFGWWAAWLNGGEVVLFDKPYVGRYAKRNPAENKKRNPTESKNDWLVMGN